MEDNPVQGVSGSPPVTPSTSLGGPSGNPPSMGGGTLDALKNQCIQVAANSGSSDPVGDGTKFYDNMLKMMCQQMINEMNQTKAKKPEDDTNV